ncbi:MAG: hypothetical protein L0Y73_00080, partial [Candidatus Aminicenantes bacterium]|nr:hypothetical protein [Candidatus Aminicenantes bacterium]
MKFKEINDAVISDDGNWVLYNCQPGRGNGEVIVYNAESGKSFVIKQGYKPAITKDGKWAAAFIKPDALALEKTNEKEKPKQALVLLETANGKITTIERIKGFAFSDNSAWLVYQLLPDEEKTKEKTGEKIEKKDAKTDEIKKKSEWEKRSAPLIMHNLAAGKTSRIENVIAFALDPASRCIAYSTYPCGEAASGIYTRNLNETDPPELLITCGMKAVFNNLSWSKKKSRLAFLFHYDKADEKKEGDKNLPGLWLWDGMTRKLKPLVTKNDIPAGWMLPAENKFTWTEDEERLFFGFKPLDEYKFYKKSEPKDDEAEAKIEEKELYSSDYLLKKTGVDVWHWSDPQINPQQKKNWDRDKKRLYLAVFHLGKNRFVRLADKEMPRLRPAENARYVLGFSQVPYMRETTWDGTYQDVYLVDLGKGDRQKILSHHGQDVELSPQGKFTAYYNDKHWFLYDNRTRQTRHLTAAIAAPFYDEDHDYPEAVPGYGIAGWLANDRALLIYDKYDIWRFSTASGQAQNITAGQGRAGKIVFRIIKTDPEQKFFAGDQECLLSAYSDEQKYTCFYGLRLGTPGVNLSISGEKKFRFVKKAKNADK